MVRHFIHEIMGFFRFFRWRMHLIKESANLKGNQMTKNSTNGSVESVQEAANTDRISSSMISTISINREPFGVGSISVIPNTTYIRPLDRNRGLGISSSINNKTDCSLPALTLKDKGMKRALKDRGMPSWWIFLLSICYRSKVFAITECVVSSVYC